MSNKKTRKRKNLSLAKNREQNSKIIIVPSHVQTRLQRIVPLPAKKFLILCEGETEEAYFNGLKTNEILKKKLSALKIEVIAPSNINGIQDNSLKGLIWEAMQRKKKADAQNSPYDEIWVVLDNDGRNSFRLTKSALVRIKQEINVQHFSILQAFENDYFLSQSSFQQFLLTLFTPPIPDISLIIQLSEKLNLFEEYLNIEAKQLFYSNNIFDYGQKRTINKRPVESNFDVYWKDYVQKAYSCRAFESWLLLHFEQCMVPFSTSDKSVAYLNKFAPFFEKGRGNRDKLRANAYDALKPNPFAEKYETLDKAQAVLDKLETAIENGAWLQQKMLAIGKRDNLEYYELDPFTDIHFLLQNLLGKEEIITWGELGKSKNWNGMSIIISFNRKTQQATLTIENKAHSRILLNSTNISNHFWIQGIKTHRRMPKIIPNGFIQGLINLEISQIDTKIIQFPVTTNDDTLYYLHFLWNKEKLIIPL